MYITLNHQQDAVYWIESMSDEQRNELERKISARELFLGFPAIASTTIFLGFVGLAYFAGFTQEGVVIGALFCAWYMFIAGIFSCLFKHDWIMKRSRKLADSLGAVRMNDLRFVVLKELLPEYFTIEYIAGNPAYVNAVTRYLFDPVVIETLRLYHETQRSISAHDPRLPQGTLLEKQQRLSDLYQGLRNKAQQHVLTEVQVIEQMLSIAPEFRMVSIDQVHDQARMRLAVSNMPLHTSDGATI